MGHRACHPELEAEGTVAVDFELAVTVRLYDEGTAEEAARALQDYRGTFLLPGDREIEILAACPLDWES